MKKKLRCILLIEDNHVVNYIHEDLLRDMDICENIQIAENGKEGLDYLTNQGKFKSNGTNYPQPDLILLDINMPVMDGWEFLQEYKKLTPEQKCKILIVMLTTSPNPDDKKKALESKEVKDFKRKPLTEQMMEDIIMKHFPDILNGKR